MSEKKITSYIIFGFKESDLTKNDWVRIRSMVPWANFHFVNGEVVVGPSVSKIEGFSMADNVDVKFDTLVYLRRMFQESIMKATGVYLPDSIFKVIHMTIEEFVNG